MVERPQLAKKIDASRDVQDQSKNDLFEKMYPWLRQASIGLLANERFVSLSPSDLVHEAALRMLKSGPNPSENRAYILAIASKVMRQVLIDHVRAKRANKRDHWRVTLMTDVGIEPKTDLRVLHHALLRLVAIDSIKSDIVEMRYFGGMSIPDIAEATGLSESTIKRHWTAARAWLLDAMENDI